MAIKPLKSIKFPGLPDTYTVPQVDSTPTQGSNNAVSSGGVYEQVEGIKEDLYTLSDATFTSGGWINLGVGIGNTVNYTVNSNLGYSYTVIDCKAGDTFLVSAKGGNNSRAWGFVDSADKLLSVATAGAYVNEQELTATADGKLIVNAYVYDLATYPYYLKYNTPKVNGLIDAVAEIQRNVAKNTNKVELVLPRTVYGVVGHEFNLYKGNALLYGNIDSVADVKFISFINSYFETRTRFSATPTSMYDNYPQVSLFKNSIKERDSFFNLHFIVKDPSILNGLTRDVVVIGDSKVAGGRLPQMLKILCENAGMNVGKLKGSIYTQSFDTCHEGRAGWSSADYFTSGRGGITNAFYNNGTFDFSYWMTQQGYSHMDYVFINLGTNDYARTDTLGSLEYIDTFISNINAMIASIHAYDPTIKIIIGLVEGVCTYKWSSDKDDYLRNLNTRARLLNRASIAEWDTTNKQNNNVWVCPIYLSMDMDNDYAMEEVPLSEWDSYFSTGKVRNNVLDTMHQNAVGYAKNATYMFALMTYIESLNA